MPPVALPSSNQQAKTVRAHVLNVDLDREPYTRTETPSNASGYATRLGVQERRSAPPASTRSIRGIGSYRAAPTCSKRWYASRSKKASLRPVWLRRPRQTRSRASRSQHAAVALHAARRAQRRGPEDRVAPGVDEARRRKARKVEVTSACHLLPMAQTPMPVEPWQPPRPGAPPRGTMPEQRALGVHARRQKADPAARQIGGEGALGAALAADGVRLVRLEQPAHRAEQRATSTSASIHSPPWRISSSVRGVGARRRVRQRPELGGH